MLLMVDRVAHVETQGDAGLGVIVGEKDVDVSEWFFKAHFFQDPVQPGSLGVEALLQLLQYFMLDTGMDADVEDARFEPMLLGAPMVWKYRGQVTPKNDMITTVMEITEVGVDDIGPFVIGAGSLWCDGLRIYEVSNMGMRLVSGPPGEASVPADSAVVVDQAAQTAGLTELPISVSLAHHPQLIDHAVNGVPVVPVVFVIEWFARLAAANCPDLHLAALTELRVLSGLIAEDYFHGGSLDVVAVVIDSVGSGEGRQMTRQLTLQLTNTATGRAHYRCTAHMTPTAPSAVDFADSNPAIAVDSEPWSSEIYFGDVLFHGPAFRVIEEIVAVSELGIDARCWGVRAVGWPNETWTSDPALLDGALQLALLWTERQLGLPSLPTGIGTVRLLSEPTFGQHTMSLVGRRTAAHMVVCDVEIRSAAGHVVAQLEGIETHVIAQSGTQPED
jgi:3-hydroxymyristoyl/3-hydroxydecanoyl-(acyl carrier protein) dehydratase